MENNKPVKELELYIIRHGQSMGNAGYDKEELVVGYKIEIKEGFGEEIKDNIEGICIYDEYLLQRKDGTIIGEFYVSLGNQYIVNKISDKEYILYSIRDVSEFNLDDEELYMSVNIYNVQGTDINGAEIEDAELKGKWNFDKESISLESTLKTSPNIVIDSNKMNAIPKGELSKELRDIIINETSIVSTKETKQQEEVTESYVSSSPDFVPSQQNNNYRNNKKRRKERYL